MTMCSPIVLYAIGSPLVADVEESCRRGGILIAGGVRNVAGPHHLSDPARVREHTDIDAELLRHPCIVPLFGPSRRRRAVNEAVGFGFVIADALVDLTAIVALSTRLGPGCYVNAGTVIGAAVRIGRHAIVNRASSIGHHTTVGHFVSIGPGVTVAGLAAIGDGAMIGAGAVILPKVNIGAGSVVGAGAVVTRDIPAGELALGNPARVVRNVCEEDGV
jgi:sugar O-acyltransferase (sialic acid O-acetyltransferase NeuD family)